ncbi:hypothetical protein BWQ96_09189 [Gracilariopsis chorda]|uniref:Uncharacterized protein n=1 Tax=Gracilariopsis chorda TaxID=448386 RepID=A0A2V3IG69_9FLOR|nr:hypothetical protein BWQ96_09189 [Gracilariopsis chorda]|eukprot:PXF41085.1 hypothetical protein BWQ96_09189 [Gracilariopsis chorda]
MSNHLKTATFAHILIDAGKSCPVGVPVAYVVKTEADIPAVKAWAPSSTANASGSPSTPVSLRTQTPAAAAAVEAPLTPPTSSGTAVSASATIVNEGRYVASPLAKATAKKGIDLRYVKGRVLNAQIMKAKVLSGKETLSAEPYVSKSGKINQKALH